MWYRDERGWIFTHEKFMTDDKDFLVMRENKSSELFLSCWLELIPIVTAQDNAGNF